MKVIYILFLIWIAAQSIQVYGQFAPLGSKWTYTTTLIVPPNTFGPYVVEVIAIEMFQGRLCSKLQYPTGASWIEAPLYIYEENDSVYFWSPYSEDFELLYDFKAGIGDSWIVSGLSVTDTNNYDDFLIITVDSISDWIHNGDTLEIMHYHHYFPYAFDWATSIIRDIGNIYALVPSFGLFEDRMGQIRCYSDPENEYQFVSFGCDSVFTTAITQAHAHENSISITPNPIQKQMHIGSTQLLSNITFRIYTMPGQLAYSKSIEIPGTYDVNFLPAGSYIFEIRDGGSLLYMGRIAIMH